MRQLFIIDPIKNIKPEKDSSVALMQAAERASVEIWICNPSDLLARGGQAFVLGAPITADPWFIKGESKLVPLTEFDFVWMRKDPPVDDVYLYATHLLELAERDGVRVLNKPASLRAWNEKLGSLRFSHLMAPTLVASRVGELATFVRNHGEVVLKPLGGRAGLGVVRVGANAPGVEALLELVTDQERLPVMAQRFLPKVINGDKRILLVNGEPLGAINRRPEEGDFRSNLAVGGRPEPTEISMREKEICEELAPSLRDHGLFFVGIDVIDGILSEINVTSPTGIREVERIMGVPLADQIIACLLTDSL